MPWPGAETRRYSFLSLLVATDVGFVVLYLVHASRLAAGDPRFSLEEDRGYAEVFQYLKLFWASALLALLLLRTRVLAFGAWSLLFAYLLLDDAMQLHERFGVWAAGRLDLGPALGLRGQDFGEWLASAVVLGTFVVLLGSAHLQRNRPGPTVSAPLFGLLLLLGVFGVMVDALHVAVRSLANTLLVVAEDGGEMLVVSVICWYVFTTWDHVAAADRLSAGADDLEALQVGTASQTPARRRRVA